jgi:hemolysin activation/secretion protein
MVLAVAPTFASSAFGQAVTPDIDGIVHNQANRAAESQNADRARRQAAPLQILPNSKAALGPFPAESPCWIMREIVVDGALHKELNWILPLARSYEDHCMATQGVRYVLNFLQGELINRGFVGTRILLPQQDLSKGTLRLQVVEGIISAVRVPNDRVAREWALAAPEGSQAGDLFQLRAVEQGVEQIQRIPGRQAHVALDPASAPGETVANLSLSESPLISASLAANDFSGTTVGAWQGSGTLTAQGILGVNELISLNYNSRIHSPDVPADTEGNYASLTIPFGWWTFGVTGMQSRYQQEVLGTVASFTSLGTQKGIAVWAQVSVDRDQNSHTQVQLQLQRRWNRSYIDYVEIGLQHQDLTDLQVSIMDTRTVGGNEFDTELSYRQGLPTILGAQQDELGRTSDLPTSRYKIAVLDLAGRVPLQSTVLAGYRIEARAQYGFNQPYGPDHFAVGGAYSIRGHDPDSAILGKSGWYVRQELATLPFLGDNVQPFPFLDLGQASASNRLLAGAGLGLRTRWHGFDLLGFAADALSRQSGGRTRCCLMGLSLTYILTAL